MHFHVFNLIADRISDFLKLHVYERKLPYTHVKSVQCYC